MSIEIPTISKKPQPKPKWLRVKLPTGKNILNYVGSLISIN